MNLRPATPDDAPGIARVRVETWQATYRGLIADGVLDRMDVDADTERYREALAMLERDQFTFVATQGAPEQVVGYCVGGAERSQDPTFTGEVYALYVLPGCQRQGVGQSLLKVAATWLRAHGHHRVIIYALDQNLPAHAFYRAGGGKAVRQKPLVIDGVTYSEIGFGFRLA